MMNLKSFFLVLAILLVNFNTYDTALYKRKKIVQDGDLMIGALIPVHEQPSFNDNEEVKVGSKRKCGVIRDQYGVQRVEALLYILDKINNKNITKILPGIKLGLEIRDECWDSSIALEETIDFIKDTIASDEKEFEKSQNSSNSLSNENDSKCQVIKEKQSKNRILAVIGPGGSTVTINVQNLLQLFDIPQLGYSATSIDLSDKQMFKSFIRVVPSDYLQVRAMVDFVVKMNWTYLFAIYTDGSYGQSGMEAFRNETSYLNICLALYEKIREYASEEDYEVVVRKMNKTANARVIVCFCYGETVRGLLGAINKLKLKGRFIILGSDGWSDRIDVAIGYYEEAIGSFSLKAFSPLVTEFDNYFTNLNPSNNLRNVWFTEYWEERFKCFIVEESMKRFKEPCKKTCPADFVKIGKNCFWFSTQNLNWKDAQDECKKQYEMSDLLDINDQHDFHLVLEHISTNPKSKIFKKIQAKIKLINGFNNITNENTQKNEHYDGDYFNEQNIKLKLCKNLDIDYKQELPTDFETSIGLGDEDVITFFNSKIYHNPTPVSIEITEIEESNDELKKNVNFCVEINNYEKKLPFICKLEAKNFKEKNLFYRNSLKNYQQDPKMSYVINSVLAIVNGLEKAHQSYCNGIGGLCEKMKKVNGSQLLKYIKETEFVGILNEKINFDTNGDPPGRYVILNVQKEINKFNSTPRYFYKEIGTWNNKDKIELNLKAIVLPNKKKHTQFKSVCSAQCEFGHVKHIKQGGLKCCWNCKKCENHSYVFDEFACNECDLGFWPNRNLTGCEKLPLTYIQWNDASSLFALLVCIIGFLINSFVAQIFIKYSNTCVVKSTTKELSFIILVGVYMCYLMTIPLILKPTLVTCYLYRILPGFSLSLMYGALLTKTNRIARILSRSKKIILTHKPKFMSLTSQIVITCIIISVECGLIVIVFILEPGSYEIIGPLGYNMMLVALCTIYAVRTRNLPENFNEAKFIGFSMYTTIVIWIAFIPLYFGSDFKVLSLCLCTSFSATVILIFLFVPKVYIILFKPEKNQRSAFATNKDLRCHFGSSATPSNNIIEPEKQSSYIDSMGNVKNNISAGAKNARYARRTKFSSIKMKTNKSVDSFEGNSSIYQINDMSCQTSLELLEPLVESELKRRKKPEKNTILEENKQQQIDKDNEIDYLENTASNINLKSISNFFSLYSTSKSKETDAEIENDQVTDLSSSRKNNPTKNFFTKSLKSFKNKNVKLNMSFRAKLDNSFFSSIKNKPDITNKNPMHDQKENYISSEDEEVNEMSIFETNQDVDIEANMQLSEKSNKINESLEDFKRVFAKNQNLVVNCDNVQSSGYL